MICRERGRSAAGWDKVTLSGQSWQDSSGGAANVWDGLGSRERCSPGKPRERLGEEHKGRKNIPGELLLLLWCFKKGHATKKGGEEKKKLFCPAKCPHPSELPEKGGSSSPEPFGLMPSSCSAARPGDEFSG